VIWISQTTVKKLEEADYELLESGYVTYNVFNTFLPFISCIPSPSSNKELNRKELLNSNDNKGKPGSKVAIFRPDNHTPSKTFQQQQQ